MMRQRCDYSYIVDFTDLVCRLSLHARVCTFSVDIKGNIKSLMTILWIAVV